MTVLKKLLEPYKSATRRRVCKICFKEFLPRSFSALKSNCEICDECFFSFKKIYSKEMLNGVEIFSIYEYSPPLDKLILQYKESLDIELSSVFLNRNKEYINFKYRKYNIVLLPSSIKAQERRGFNHLYEIFKTLKIPIIKDALLKTEETEQKKLDHLSRITHKNFMKVNENVDFRNKNILLVDDIFSSGASLKEAINLLKNVEVRKIKALVLCKNKNNWE